MKRFSVFNGHRRCLVKASAWRLLVELDRTILLATRGHWVTTRCFGVGAYVIAPCSARVSCTRKKYRPLIHRSMSRCRTRGPTINLPWQPIRAATAVAWFGRLALSLPMATEAKWNKSRSWLLPRLRSMSRGCCRAPFRTASSTHLICTTVPLKMATTMAMRSLTVKVILIFWPYFSVLFIDFYWFSLGNPEPIKVPPTVNRYVIGQLEPFTVYKIVMSVETQFGEGQSSVPIMNRTAEGSTWPAFFYMFFFRQNISRVRSVMLFFISKNNFLTEPSVPLDLDLVEVTNRSLSITWRAPLSPNGASTYYQIFRSNDTNVWATAVTTQVKN